MANINIKSYNEILGDLARSIIANTPINDLNPGSAIMTLLEAVASNDFENSTAVLNVLELLNIDATSNNDLDALGSNYGLVRIAAQRSSGFVSFYDTSITKKSSALYPIKPAPIRGSRVIYITNASGWNQVGQIFIGRGTQNFEGPISYGNTGTAGIDRGIINYGSYFGVYLDSALNNDHLISEYAVWGQGTSDRNIPAGTTIKIPANNISPEIIYSTIRAAIIPAGEDTITGIMVIAQVAGSSSNAGIGTVTKIDTAPFASCAVTNTNSFTNGRDVESDIEFRNRIKSYSGSLARGTSAAILAAIEGLSDVDEGKRVVSSVIVEPIKVGDPSILYVDDGSGFEPSYQGQSVDPLIDSATGKEEFLQLSNFPLPRPQVVNTSEAPFLMTDGMVLKVAVDGEEESIYFSASQFKNMASASIYEVVIAINQSSVNFKCRLTANSTKLLIYPVLFDAETIQVIGTDSANAQFKFPTNEFSYIKLYKNSQLLKEKQKSATLNSIIFSSWNISSPGTLVLSVDGTPAQSQYFDSTDFGGVNFSSLTLSDYVTAFNNKFAGITCTYTSTDKLVITSNKTGSASSLQLLGGSWLSKMFSGVALTAVGQNSDFKLNRQNGSLQVLTTINSGDSISAGSTDTKGSIVSSATNSGIFNLSNDPNGRPAEIVVVVDAARVYPRQTIIPIGSAITLSNPSGQIMRILSSVASVFEYVQPFDYIYLTNRGDSDGSGTGAWLDIKSSGLYKIIAKGEHTSDGVDTWVEVVNVDMVVGGPYSVVDNSDIKVFFSDKYPQIWRGSYVANAPVNGVAAAATLSNIVDSIFYTIRGVKASIYRTNSVKLTSATEDGGSIAIPVAIGNAVGLFTGGTAQITGNESHIANKVTSKDIVSYFETANESVAWLSRHSLTDLKGSLTSNAQPDNVVYGETLEDTTKNFNTAIDYDKLINITDGNNKSKILTVQAIPTDTTISTRKDLPMTLMDYRTVDQYQVVSGMSLASDDSIVIIMDNDSVAKTVDMRFSRTGIVNSGSNGGTHIPNSTSFSADDADNEPGIDFGSVNVWGTLASQRSTNFNDYGVMFMARNWYIANGDAVSGASMIIRSNQFGKIGENYQFNMEYPLQPNKSSSISHSNSPLETVVSYVYGSGSLRATSLAAGFKIAISELTTPVYGYSSGKVCRLTFDLIDNPDFSSVVAGDIINIDLSSGFSSSNCGVFKVLAANNTNKTIDIYNPNGVDTVVGIAEQTDINCVFASDITSGQYFTINSALDANEYYVWYDKDSLGGDPLVAGKTGISVAISTGDNDAVVAAATQAAIANFVSEFSVSRVGNTVTVLNLQTGLTTHAANFNVGGSFIILVTADGLTATYEYISIPSAINIYPLLNTSATDVVAKINEGPILNAVVVSIGNGFGTATREEFASVANGHDEDPTSGKNSSIGLYDSHSYVSEFSNANPNFTLKTPLVLPVAASGDIETYVYKMDTAKVNGTTILGEPFKLVPVTITNIKHHMSHKALSQLSIVSSIDIAQNFRKIQLKSNLLGSYGGVEVVGGRANYASFKIFGDSQVVDFNNRKYLEFTIASSPDTIAIGDYVKLQNDNSVSRYSRLSTTDTIDVVKYSSSLYEYRNNAKVTNFDASTDITIVDANTIDPVSYPTAGIVWRWTHSNVGTETLSNVKVGDQVCAWGLIGWQDNNMAGPTGDRELSGHTIIKVNSAAHYFDVVNPFGSSMSVSSIGIGTILVYPSYVIEWKLKHSAYNEIASISTLLSTATATTRDPHHMNVGDTFSIYDNSVVPTTPGASIGTVVSVSSAFTFTFLTSSADGNYFGGRILRSGASRSRYSIESLGYNNMFRLRSTSGDSPKFLSCGVAVDDILNIGGNSFNSINSGEFRILAVDEDCLIYENAAGKEEINSILPLNYNSILANWVSNLDSVTGIAGTFANVNIGDWVKKTDDSDIYYLQVIAMNSAPSTATSITIGGLYRGTSGSSSGVKYDQATGANGGIYLSSERDIRILEGDSVRIDDNFYVSSLIDSTWFSTTNCGTFNVIEYGSDAVTRKPFLRVINAAGVAQTGVQLSAINSSIYVIEGVDSRFTSIKKVAHIAIDEKDLEKRVIYLTPGDREYKWNRTNSTNLIAMGKIGYSSGVITGVDGYQYYTGLLRTVQRTVDGFEPDANTYPGRKAIGSTIEILPPLVKKISIVISVTTNNGVNISEINNEIRSAVLNHVNNLKVNEDVVLSDIVVKVMGIDGVAAVTFVSPAPSTERIFIAANEKSYVEPSDISIA